MSAAAFVTDLIFATKITSTAKDVGAPVKIVRTLEQLKSRLASATDSIIIIDLNADGVDALEAVGVCAAAVHHPRIIAFASHVQAELINSAREAGADEVMPRSAFVSKLPAILASVVNQDIGGYP
jgi:DNA-binding NarL/FixJ family response regulator